MNERVGCRQGGLGVAAAALLALLAAGCGDRKPLDVLGQVPEFRLTAQNGQAFGSGELDGSIWVADFIFTTCQGPCPMMSSHMRRLQTETAQLPDVKLVSFTVDPQNDTPPVLAAYAKRYKADDRRWFFLTGAAEALNELSLNAFHLSKIDKTLAHSTRFALVDRERRIRGYYLSSQEGFLEELLRDIRKLDRERR
jgi:protein SCO1/2